MQLRSLEGVAKNFESFMILAEWLALQADNARLTARLDALEVGEAFTCSVDAGVQHLVSKLEKT